MHVRRPWKSLRASPISFPAAHPMDAAAPHATPGWNTPQW
jgi:hypothetical protein